MACCCCCFLGFFNSSPGFPTSPFRGRSIYSKQPRSKTLVHMQEPNKSPFCWGWVTCVNPCHPGTRARQRGGWNLGAPADPAPHCAADAASHCSPPPSPAPLTTGAAAGIPPDICSALLMLSWRNSQCKQGILYGSPML